MEFILNSAHPAVWLWVIAAVVLAIIEAFTMGLTTIWFAGGALASAVVSLVTNSILIQVLVFVLVSLGLLFLTRPLALKKLNPGTVRTNLDAIVGATALAESDVKEHGRGSARVDGKVWTAVLAEGSPEVEKGDLVKVERIEGVKLIVRKEIL